MEQPVAYVIAHSTSPVAAECWASLTKHGWQYKKFTAVDGRSLTDVSWANINVNMSKLGKMRKRQGAQGCWMSHFLLWQQCATQNTPIIILEHDAVVQDKWPVDLDITTHLVKLYTTAECKVNQIYGRWSKGSHAYTLTPAQAVTLIEFSQHYGAQALDKHLGDAVLPWTFYNQDLITLNPRRGPSTTSRISKIGF